MNNEKKTSNEWTPEDWEYYRQAAIATACAYIQRPSVVEGMNPQLGAATIGDDVATKLVELKRQKAGK